MNAPYWVGLVGVPSTKKTPIMSAVIKTLMRLDGDLLRTFLFETEQYKNLTPEERKKTNAAVAEAAAAGRHDHRERTGRVAGSPDGVLLHQDELSGWFGSMDKYSGRGGAAKDRAFWLESYNGGSIPSTVLGVVSSSFQIIRSACSAASSRISSESCRLKVMTTASCSG